MSYMPKISRLQMHCSCCPLCTACWRAW